MKDDTKHSPTPWAIGPDGIFVDDADGATICVPNVNRRANARHIVRCVNGHEKLVETLSEIAAFAVGNGDVCEIIARRARAALAEVDGE